MAKNKTGGLIGGREWGSKARKREDAQRGLNNRARIETITEQFKEWWDSRAGLEVPCPYCKGRGHDDRGTECGFCEGGIHVLGT